MRLSSTLTQVMRSPTVACSFCLVVMLLAVMTGVLTVAYRSPTDALNSFEVSTPVALWGVVVCCFGVT